MRSELETGNLMLLDMLAQGKWNDEREVKSQELKGSPKKANEKTLRNSIQLIFAQINRWKRKQEEETHRHHRGRFTEGQREWPSANWDQVKWGLEKKEGLYMSLYGDFFKKKNFRNEGVTLKYFTK